MVSSERNGGLDEMISSISLLNSSGWRSERKSIVGRFNLGRKMTDDQSFDEKKCWGSSEAVLLWLAAQ
jgi:hypothetical protein